MAEPTRDHTFPKECASFSSSDGHNRVTCHQKLLNLEQKLEEQEGKLRMLSLKQQELEEKNRKYETEKQELEKNSRQQIQELKAEVKKQEMKFEKQFEEVFNCSRCIGYFEVINLRSLIIETSKWAVFSKSRFRNSSFMYTHVCGYKFFIRIKCSWNECSWNECYVRLGGVASATTIGACIYGPIGAGIGACAGLVGATILTRITRGKVLYASMQLVQGEYDDDLKWPVKATFTIEIVNKRGGKNASCTITRKWDRPHVQYNEAVASNKSSQFIELIKCSSLLGKFEHNDTLCIKITNVKILDL